jgi:hypothetical protein
MRALRDFLLAPAPSEPPERAVRAPRAVLTTRRGRAGAVRALLDFVLAPPATAGRADPLEAEAHAASAAGESLAAPTAPVCAAVLCAATDARALGIAAAALLARRHRAPCALVCVWTAECAPAADPSSRPPAARAARRLAAALGAHRLDALACGRAAVVTLPVDPAGAVAAAGRAAAVAGAAPAVLVLGGPRLEALDGLLADCDRVIVAGRAGDEDVAPLAVAGLGPLADRTAAATVTLGPVGRALAASGLGVPAALRRALEEAR